MSNPWIQVQGLTWNLGKQSEIVNEMRTLSPLQLISEAKGESFKFGVTEFYFIFPPWQKLLKSIYLSNLYKRLLQLKSKSRGVPNRHCSLIEVCQNYNNVYQGFLQINDQHNFNFRSANIFCNFIISQTL